VEFLELYDSARGRSIPVAIYSPAASSLGWLLFSVGFGGTCQSYAFLGRAWSQRGFQVAVIEHVGSNDRVLKEIHRPGMRQAQLAEVVGERARDPQEMKDRPLDVALVRQQLCSQADWVGVGGHSFGSYTTLAVLGCEMLLPDGPRRWQLGLEWKAALLMSPPPPDTVITRRGLSEVTIPSLWLTGTRDSGMPAGVTYQQRLESYAQVPSGHKWQALLEGVDHMALAGLGLAVKPVVETLSQVTGQFWSQIRAGARLGPMGQGLPVEVHIESN